MDLLKKNYNILLARYKKAEKAIENTPVVPKVWQEEFIKISKSMGTLLNSIRDYTEEEALRGFKEIGGDNE